MSHILLLAYPIRFDIWTKTTRTKKLYIVVLSDLCNTIKRVGQIFRCITYPTRVPLKLDGHTCADDTMCRGRSGGDQIISSIACKRVYNGMLQQYLRKVLQIVFTKCETFSQDSFNVCDLLNQPISSQLSPL